MNKVDAVRKMLRTTFRDIVRVNPDLAYRETPTGAVVKRPEGDTLLEGHVDARRTLVRTVLVDGEALDYEVGTEKEKAVLKRAREVAGRLNSRPTLGRYTVEVRGGRLFVTYGMDVPTAALDPQGLEDLIKALVDEFSAGDRDMAYGVFATVLFPEVAEAMKPRLIRVRAKA